MADSTVVIRLPRMAKQLPTSMPYRARFRRPPPPSTQWNKTCCTYPQTARSRRRLIILLRGRETQHGQPKREDSEHLCQLHPRPAQEVLVMMNIFNGDEKGLGWGLLLLDFLRRDFELSNARFRRSESSPSATG